MTGSSLISRGWAYNPAHPPWRSHRVLASARMKSSPSLVPAAWARSTKRARRALIGPSPSRCSRDVSGVGEERVLFQGKELSPWWYWGPDSVDWSPDGRHVIFSTGQPDTAADLNVLTLDAPAERAVTPFARTAFDELSGLFSPDGKWIAYTSNESGRHEVYVQPFPETGAKVMVSTHGGSQPRWRGDGRELFYLTPDPTLMAVPVKPDSPFSVGTPARLFKAPVANPLWGRNHYVPSWDGRRFLVNVLTPDRNDPQRLVVVVNWTAALPQMSR
jgi:hypothetical protein